MNTPKPSTPESAKTARQSSHSSTKPPSVGASIGAIRIAVAVAASAEAAFAGPKWSRIVARMTDIAAPPPKACITRATTSSVERFRDDAGGAAEHEKREREQHDAPAPIAVGERRDHQVAERDREDRQADEQLRRMRRDVHRERDRGQRRQQHVQAEGADRADDRGACDQPPGSVACLQAGILQRAVRGRNRPLSA